MKKRYNCFMYVIKDMKKKLFLNTIMSFLLQITTVICGFILPRLMLKYYGSEVNGLTQSIAQFLYIVSFLELGVGQVIQSCLYKPLSIGDLEHISKIIKSGNSYFRLIALVLIGYIALLSIFSPYVFGVTSNSGYIITLVLVMGVGSFAQYYFGLVDKILLNADQKGYVQVTLQIFANLLNVLLVSSFMHRGYPIQIVKLASAVIFLFVPIIIRFYINKNYKINRKIEYCEEPIKQKWNGAAQHIATVIFEGTDVIVLTLLSTLSNVSIYSVYCMVISGVRQLYTSATAGIQSMVGALWTHNDKKQFENVFHGIEIILHFVVVFLFCCVGILIVPFVRVYTQGIKDCNYIQPLFALVLTIAYAIRCLRTPYNILILAVGHYKQTQSCHIVSAVLNVVVSIVAVSLWGLVGIAIGTLIAYAYQTVWMMFYNSKNLLHWPLHRIIKQVIVDISTAVLICLSTACIKMETVSYLGWFKMAIIVAIMAFLITSIMAVLFYLPQIKVLYRMIKR